MNDHALLKRLSPLMSRHVAPFGGHTVVRSCDSCGDDYDAKQPTSKFCGATCRKRASRGALVPVTRLVTDVTPDCGPVESALMVELDEAGRRSSALGQAALLAARKLDMGNDTGAGTASLLREYRATAVAAMENAKRDASPLDQLRERRLKRLA